MRKDIEGFQKVRVKVPSCRPNGAEKVEVVDERNLAPFAVALRNAMRIDFEARFPVGDLPEVFLLATALDPRSKDLYVYDLPQATVGRVWGRIKRELNSIMIDMRGLSGGESGGTKRDADGQPKTSLSNFLGHPSSSSSSIQRNILSAASLSASLSPNRAGRLHAQQEHSSLEYHREIQNEVAAYTLVPALDMDSDPFQWWREHKASFPHLAILAMKYLCIPATSAAVERLFSKSGLIVSALRSCMSSSTLEELIYMKLNWMDKYLGVKYMEPLPEEEESEGEYEYMDEDLEELEVLGDEDVDQHIQNLLFRVQSPEYDDDDELLSLVDDEE